MLFMIGLSADGVVAPEGGNHLHPNCVILLDCFEFLVSFGILKCLE